MCIDSLIFRAQIFHFIWFHLPVTPATAQISHPKYTTERGEWFRAPSPHFPLIFHTLLRIYIIHLFVYTKVVKYAFCWFAEPPGISVLSCTYTPTYNTVWMHDLYSKRCNYRKSSQHNQDVNVNIVNLVFISAFFHIGIVAIIPCCQCTHTASDIIYTVYWFFRLWMIILGYCRIIGVYVWAKQCRIKVDLLATFLWEVRIEIHRFLAFVFVEVVGIIKCHEKLSISASSFVNIKRNRQLN